MNLLFFYLWVFVAWSCVSITYLWKHFTLQNNNRKVKGFDIIILLPLLIVFVLLIPVSFISDFLRKLFKSKDDF